MRGGCVARIARDSRRGFKVLVGLQAQTRTPEPPHDELACRESALIIGLRSQRQAKRGAWAETIRRIAVEYGI